MADLDDLLVKTSRTFALAIPLLPEPTRTEVSVAYLLFRIADTFEDATRWPQQQRIEALHQFAQLVGAFESPIDKNALNDQVRVAVAGWLKSPPCDHPGYLELLRETPFVLNPLHSMSISARHVLIEHTRRTALGMAEVVSLGDAKGNLRLNSVEALQRYCYIVAGIVGELLTALFLNGASQLEPARAVLESKMVAFGEALQLVNILKDAGDDLKDGRVYLPPQVPRGEIIELARHDLDEAALYVEALQRAQAPRGFLAFTAMPVMLAQLALEKVESDGPGAKVSRLQVASSMAQLNQLLDTGGDVKRLLAQV